MPLFRTELQYIGNTMFIKDRRVYIKPLRSRLETIQKLQPPTTAKGCRSFAGMVNFLSMFCPELQKLLKPIYDLTRNGRQFIWGKEQQTSFEKIKHRLINPPVLHLPNRTGRFHLYSNTSRFSMGSASNTEWKTKVNSICKQKVTRGSKKLFHYRFRIMWFSYKHSKFFSLIKKSSILHVIRSLSLRHIIKSKAEPPTARIKRLLELISSYLFNLYYIKGKDMILNDFLSRQKHNDSNPCEIIPISFNMHSILHKKYFNIGKSDKYLVQTWSQTRSSGIKLLKVHGMSKNLDPNIQPEKQNIKSLKGNEITQEKPRIGQGKAGMRRRRPPPINQTTTQT